MGRWLPSVLVPGSSTVRGLHPSALVRARRLAKGLGGVGRTKNAVATPNSTKKLEGRSCATIEQSDYPD